MFTKLLSSVSIISSGGLLVDAFGVAGGHANLVQSRTAAASAILPPTPMSIPRLNLKMRMQQQDSNGSKIFPERVAVGTGTDGFESSSRLFSYNSRRGRGCGHQNENQDNDVGVPKVFRNTRTNSALFSASTRSSPQPKRRWWNRNRDGYKSPGSVRNTLQNARLALLMKAANMFEEKSIKRKETSRTLSIDDFMDIEEELTTELDTNEFEDVVVPEPEDVQTPTDFSLKTDFENLEKKNEIDVALGHLNSVEARKSKIIQEYSKSDDDGERAFAMLLELGLVQLHLDPDDEDYDNSLDNFYAPENEWI